MTAKEQLQQLVALMSEEEAAAALDELRWRFSDEEETLSEEELALVRQGLEEIRRGKYVTLEELKRRYAECATPSVYRAVRRRTSTASIRPRAGASFGASTTSP